MLNKFKIPLSAMILKNERNLIVKFNTVNGYFNDKDVWKHYDRLSKPLNK